MNLQELLAQVSDDLEIPIGTEKIKASELKAFKTASDTEKRQFESKRQEAERMAQEAKNVFDGLKAAQEEFARKTAPPPDTRKDDWRKNPLYEDIVPVLDAALNAAREAAEVAKSTKSQLDNTSALYAIERMRNEYEKAEIKPTDKRFEDLVAEAVAAKELDAQGMPTLSKVLNRYSEPKRMEAYAEQKIAEAKKEWEKKARISEVPKPGKFHNVKGAEAPIKNLEQLTSELVANDPDIQAAMNDDRTH